MFNYKLSRFLFFFLSINAVSAAFIAFVPISARHPDSIFSSVLVLTFMSFFVCGCIFFFLLLNGMITTDRNITPPSLQQLNFNVKMCSILPIVGFFMVFFDRVYIRGIDYSQGLRMARYMWLESGSGSFFGVLGNLFIPFSYIALFILLTQSRNLIKSHRVMLIASAFFGIVGHAALNGGRSNVLIAMFVSIFCILVRDKPMSSKSSNRLFKLFIMIFLISFILYMTSLSAKMADITYKELSILGIENLYGTVGENYEKIGDYFGEAGYLMTYIFSYLFHGAWTAQSLPFIEASQELEGCYLLFSFSVILRELGILEQSISPGFFSEYGAFISLPGALYYDTGLIGVSLLSSILGAMVGSGLALIKTKRAGPFIIGMTMYTVVISLMSPILPAYGLMYFNFVLFAFVIFSIVNKFKFRSSTYWL